MFHQRRIVMLANPRFGYLSPSWKVREALEAAGHAVFWFTPDRWPQLFSSELVDPSPLAALCGRWKADALVAADGIALDAAPRPAGTAYVTLAQTDDELERSMRKGSGTPERAWLLPRVDASRLEDERTVVSRLDGRIDATARVPANTIAFGPGIVCAQDATEARVTALRGLERAVDDVPIRCLGAGWPEEWSFNRTTSDALYACAAGGALLAFPDDGGARDAAAGDYFARAFEQLSGCTVIRANDCADPSELGGIVELSLRCRRAQRGRRHRRESSTLVFQARRQATYGRPLRRVRAPRPGRGVRRAVPRGNLRVLRPLQARLALRLCREGQLRRRVPPVNRSRARFRARRRRRECCRERGPLAHARAPRDLRHLLG